MIEKLKFVSERVENIVGKGGNAGYHHFLLFFRTMFPKRVFLRVVDSQNYVVKSEDTENRHSDTF